MIALIAIRSRRASSGTRARYRGLLLPCVFAIGCSLEVAGNARPNRPGFEAGVEGTEDSPQFARPDGTQDAHVPDDRVPSGSPDGGAPAEPDAAAPVDAGSVRDAALDAAGSSQPDAQSAPDASTHPAMACDLEGRFALRVAFDVTWVGTEFLGIVPVIQAGEGELSFVVLMGLTPSADGFDTAFRTCSSDVPEFVAAISRERFQAVIEDEVWDSEDMPLLAGTLTTGCLEPGCDVSAEPLIALIGAELSPPDAPWPSQARGGKWPDHDGDGEPGIATKMLGPDDGPYAYPPLDLLSTRRERAVALGLRVLLGFDGKIASCDKLSGATSRGSIQTRAVGCTASGPPLACTSAELEFLNNNLPVWTTHEGRFEARRLSPSADCAEARRAFARR